MLMLENMCQDCYTTNYTFAVFVVSLSLTTSVKCSVFLRTLVFSFDCVYCLTLHILVFYSGLKILPGG